MPQRLAAEGRSHGRRQDSDDQAGGQGAKGVNMDTMRDGSEEDTISGSSNTGSSYTSSSYCGSTDSDDSGSDDTFYVPEDKREDGLDGTEDGSGRGGITVQITVDGDGDDAGQTKIEIPPTSTRKEQVVDEDKSIRSGAKTGRPKRKRPANRHYIKDETMRTLFGLLPFYGGGDGPMDQMVKATLASVGPNTIDVRDQEGNTLLILACQHACEDLVDPILAKGANPTAVNGVGICPLHYTCYSDSLSLEAAEALLWRGADPCAAETTYGCTPLHYAASSGDADLCTLLVEHGAQPQAHDYYTYTAIKYAKDAGHDPIVDLLGGDTEEWLDAEETYTIGEAGDGADSTPSGGLWLRHMDPETGLAYYMNDETGESWWETDLLAATKDFLASPAIDGAGGAKDAAATALPPLSVREWLLQEQVRSWLVAIFSRADPLRLMEVDLVMELGKADFKGMLKTLLVRYGVKEVDFLRNAASPKLESLGVSSLIPSEDELGPNGDEKVTPSSSEGGGTEPSNQKQHPATENSVHLQPHTQEGRIKSGGNVDPAASATVAGDNIATTSGGGHVKSTTLNRVVSAQHCLKRIDSPAVLRADADRLFQEAAGQQERELAEERRRQKEVLDEQGKVVANLEENMQRRQTAMARTKEESDEVSGEVDKLKSTLADDSTGQDASDRFSAEISQLKADVAAERVRFSHITEALEATKGSLEERVAKQQALENDRLVRLEQLGSNNVQEVETLRTEAAEVLTKAESAWTAEKNELERGLVEQVEHASKHLKETVDGAEEVLSEAAAATKSATDAAKKEAGVVEEARAWMRENEQAHSNSKQIDHTNKQLHTSLRREMERAKQLHNQIEDTKGQTRIYARVRPMDAQEKEAGCKEVCLRDGKQTLALLTGAQQHWTYTHVFQEPSADITATIVGQAELYREVAGLGTSVADGHSVLLLAVGAATSGKTLTLLGSSEEARSAGGFFLAEAPGEATGAGGATAVDRQGDEAPSKKPTRKAKGKGGGIEGGAADTANGGGGGVAARTIPLAGIFPRLMAETFASLAHRNAQCSFVVSISAAAVSLPPPNGEDGGGLVECLLPPPLGDRDNKQTESQAGGEATSKEERDPHFPPPAPPEDRHWGRALPASSPKEAMSIVEDARSRATEIALPASAGGGRHFLSRVRVELLNRSTSESSTCEMVIIELAEERPGDSWPSALAGVVRAHAMATPVAKSNETETSGSGSSPLLGMVRGCLADTAKVVTLLCLSPADNQAEKTERSLSFGKACENSGDGAAAQLKDLKKELARRKKESKGTKKPAPSQLPRPAGGRRS